jgi:hypothetical protein
MAQSRRTTSPTSSTSSRRSASSTKTRSETGEILSGTSNELEVRKGTTETKATEESNILTGASASFSAPFGGGSASVRGEWGTREKSGTETVDMTTTDASRERRETTSHTTSFNQLYQLLNAYHLGTNRCVCLVAPRPHIVTTETGQIDFNLLDGPAGWRASRTSSWSSRCPNCSRDCVLPIRSRRTPAARGRSGPKFLGACRGWRSR